MAWLKDEGFGGIMVWSIDMDDFRGSCGTGKYPLITAMKQELGDYKVKLEYDGPYESSNPNGQYTTKDRKYITIIWIFRAIKVYEHRFYLICSINILEVYF